MPRLLLVDDNPSIHKIAESLLAQSKIELVCAESGPKALGIIESSSPFDVALIDISMAEMDGWELLAKLRAAPGTARMPIAMMAGVLDTVDPERVAHAPIQGFFKKPVELRDLADRIQVLLDTPVPEPEAAPEPEPKSEPEPEPAPAAPSPFATLPVIDLSNLQARLDTSEVLELTEADLFPEEAQEVPAPVSESPLEEELDLEELDLDSLKDLSDPEELPQTEAAAEVEASTLPDLPFDPDIITVEDLPDIMDEEAPIPVEPPSTELQESIPEPEPLELPADSLEELLESPFPEPEEDFTEEAPEAPSAPVQVEEPPAAAALGELPGIPGFILPAVPPVPQPEAPAALPEETPAKPLPEPPPENPTAQAVAAAILADPALLSALAKAVATQLSGDTLREIAWEIMPEIAERKKLL